jgi:hypothetical protein
MASDPAYADGWIIGDNGGTGFKPWTGNGSTGAIPVMEIDVAPAESDNDLGSPAFRIGTGGVPDELFSSFSVTREFTTPMQAGQSFKIDFDSYVLYDGTPPGSDLLLKFSSASGERIAFYSWDGMNANDGSEYWGVNALTAYDNLDGGAHLPPDPLSGIEWQSDYSVTDSSDGMTLQLDIVTIDTYRLRVFDDNMIKLDVSGELKGGARAGQGITSINIYGSDIHYDPPTEPGHTAYFNNMQVLVTPPEGDDGDYNENGTVDAADYVAWRKNQAEFGGPQGYDDWRSQFGESGGGGGSFGSPAVPEPTSVVLLLLGCAVALRVRHFR